jgi:hypothetical protein
MIIIITTIIITLYLKTDMCTGYNSDTKEMRKRKEKENGRRTDITMEFCYLHVAPGNLIPPREPDWNLSSRDVNLTVLGK